MFLLKSGGTLKVSRERGILIIPTQLLSIILHKPQRDEGGSKDGYNVKYRMQDNHKLLA